MLKNIICLILVLFCVIDICSGCAISSSGNIVDTPPCPFVVGAKVQVKLSSFQASFFFEVIGDLPGNFTVPTYMVQFGDGSNATFSMSLSGSIPPWTNYTNTGITHTYSSAGVFTYTFHALSALTTNLASFKYTEFAFQGATTTGDLLLSGNLTVQTGNNFATPVIQYWDTPTLPSPYPFVSTSTQINSSTAANCYANNYPADSIYSASFNSSITSCQVSVSVPYFVSNLIRLNFQNSFGDTATAFVVQPSCCQDTNNLLGFKDTTGAGFNIVNNVECTTAVQSAFISPVYGGGCPTNSSVIVNSTTSSITPFTCGSVVSVTTINDACGIPSNFTQTITIKDRTAPTIYFANGTAVVQPTNIVVLQCREQLPDPYTDLYAQDTCTPGFLAVNFTQYNNSVVNGTCLNNFEIVYSYSAIDLCNNVRLVAFTYQVLDTTAPLFNPASLPVNPIYVQCRSQLPQYNITGTDNCLDGETVSTGVLPISGSNNCTNLGVLNRTWTISDPCGNKNVFVQTAYINNSVAPVFVNLPTQSYVQVFCDNAVPASANVSELDACNGYSVILPVTSVTFQSSCVYNITRTWTLSDSCVGASSSFTQVVSVLEVLPPSFYVISPVGQTVANIPSGVFNFQCSANYAPDAPVLGAISACGESLNVNFNQTGPGPYNPNKTCAYNTILTRSWSAVDKCGNTNQISETYIVEDTTPPSFTNIPANNTYFQCLAQVPPAELVTAFDNCDPNVTALYEGQQNTTCSNNDCTNRIIIYRTWNATDSCGNFARVNETIVVYDDTAPQFTTSWTDLNPGVVSCDKASSYRVPCREAVDNCGGPVSVTTEVFGNLATAEGLIVDYTATDSCGNTNYERVTVLSNCVGGALEPILANYEPDPSFCRPLLPISSVVPTIVVGNDTEFEGCTLVNGTYDCSNRTSFTVFANGTVISYPFPINDNPPPLPVCGSKRSEKRDLVYEDLVKRGSLSAPTGYVPIFNPDYSFFYCPQQVLQCYQPAVAGNETLDPFRLCPDSLYTTVPNKRFEEEMKKRKISPPAIDNTIVISEACLEYLQVPICAPSETSAAGAFFYEVIYQELEQGKYPTTSKGNRKFFSRFFTDLKCNTFEIVKPDGSFVEIIDASGQCVGPLCQTLTLTTAINGVNGGSVTPGTPPACVDNCISISGPNLTTQCVTFQSPTQANCFPNVIQSISADGTVTCGQACIQSSQVATNCAYGIQEILDNGSGSSCINLPLLNTCDVNNQNQLRVVYGSFDNLADSNGNFFTPGTLVVCSCATSGTSTVCNWSTLVNA